LDTNDRWFNNPQYRVTVTKRTQLIISLMQEDEKISKRPYIPVNFMIVRVKSKRDRLWEVNKEDIVLQAAEGGQRLRSARSLVKILIDANEMQSPNVVSLLSAKKKT
jgi:hypothetical protein